MKTRISILLLAFFLIVSFNSFSQSGEWSKWKETNCNYITYRVKFKDYKNSYTGQWRWIVEIKNTSNHTINVEYELKDTYVKSLQSACCSRDIKPYSTASGIEFFLDSKTEWVMFHRINDCH